MTSNEYEIWREYIWQRTGLYFADNRIPLLSRHLSERMRARRIETHNAYYIYLTQRSTGEGEWLELMELLLNNETGFFRHSPSFQALRDYMVPQIMSEKQKHGINTIFIWSAGCSTGQEAYSIAMVLLEMGIMQDEGLGSVESRIGNLPTGGGVASSGELPSPVNHPPLTPWLVRVSASDISQRNLQKARRGRYSHYEVRDLPSPYRENHLIRIEEDGGDSYQVDERVRSIVDFGHNNINNLDNHWISAQDVIFCQNVLIYFKPESREAIVQDLCRRLNPGGFLVLAPAEAVGLKIPGVRAMRQKDTLIYQRTPQTHV
jgi:chemotaxis protein methyltransferase CheR